MTAADFLNKFPEFKAVDEARIELSLDEAGVFTRSAFYT